MNLTIVIELNCNESFNEPLVKSLIGTVFDELQTVKSHIYLIS